MDDHRVLVVGSGQARTDLAACLGIRGYSCSFATSVDEAVDWLGRRQFRFTAVELATDDPDATADVRRRLKTEGSSCGPIVGVLPSRASASGDEECGRWGVDALVRLPIEQPELDAVIADIVMMLPRRVEHPAADALSGTREELELWRSAKMRAVRQIVAEAAAVDVTVLITGETGTGKEVVARAVRDLSSRRDRPFVKVNCAAMPRELLESELFGHERGAFTGAHKLKVGKFESANNGTMFLDEIGDLHPSLQAKLLHVLQDGDFSRVGGKSTLRVDVRVIAATNQDLERAVLQGQFREDLYYRLNVVHIAIPPLRERVEEIPGFIRYFVDKYAKLYGRQGFTIPETVMTRLLHHRYRGNVRELENLIKRMVVLGDPLLNHIGLPEVPGAVPGPREPMPSSAFVSLRDIVRGASVAAERDAIRRMLDEAGWNRVRTAKALRISYRALLYKMKRLGLRDEAAARPPRWQEAARFTS